MQKRIFLMTVTIVLVLNYFVPVGHGEESVPAIGLTYVPRYGSFEDLRGNVLNADPNDFVVAVYIRVDGLWWSKPYRDSPVTRINSDGIWVCDITTGGIDETATSIVAYLIPTDYKPFLVSGNFQLPQDLEEKALAKAGAGREVLGKVSIIPRLEAESKIDIKERDVDKLKGVCYGPFWDKENPDVGVYPDFNELEADIEFIPKVATAIRTYGSTNTLGNIPVLCEKVGIDCYLGAWLGKYKTENRKEIENLIQIANKGFKHVKALIVGNEVLLRKDMTEEELLAYIREVKKSTTLPITMADTWSSWTDHWRIANEVDFLTVHIHPYWEGIPIGDAASYVIQRWNAMKKRFPDKRIVIGETGWPSKGKTIGEAIASPENQTRFFKEFTQLAQKQGIEYFFFELFDEKWKDKFEGKAGAHWGIYNSDGSLKEQLKSLLPQEAHQVIVRPVREVLKTRILAPVIIYKDGGSEENKFYPSGWMGDIECIELDKACEINPHSGKTCIRIDYNPRLFVFRRWSGIYWQYPLNNWGDYPGYELLGANKLTFWARGEKGKEMAEFKSGGLRVWRKSYRDSFGPVSTGVTILTSEWQKYTLDLKNCDTSNVIGGFCFTSMFLENPNGCTIYLDDIQFEP